MKPTANILSVASADILTTIFKTNVGDPLTRAPFSLSANLSAFAGQTVRLRFAMADDQFFFQVGVDDVKITSVPTNIAPVASSQSVAVNEGTPANITLGASDADNNPLTYTIVSAPTHGTLSGTGANRTYTPANNYAGPDSFTFKANDGTIDSNIATVSIMVNEVPSLIVDTTQDVTANDGLTSLREAVNYANSLPSNDTVTFSVTGTIRLLTTLPNIVNNGTLTITNTQAGGVTISGDANNSGTNNTGDVQLLNVNSGANLSLNNLTLSGGRAEGGEGGAIRNLGTLAITNSTLSGNTANQGGAIYAYSPVTITNSTLSGNSAGDGAGAIFFYQTSVEIVNSTVNNNSTLINDGGAVYNLFGTLTVTGSTFNQNSAPRDGGVIANNGNGPTTITNSTFSGNLSQNGNGGAVVINQGTFTVQNSTFSGNSAVGGTSNGGAIYVNPSNSTLVVQNSTLSGNSAVAGGGIFNNATLVVQNSTLSGNTSVGDGGAVYNANGITNVTNSTLSGNSTTYGGGAIRNGDGGTLDLANTTVSGNTANYGGAILNFNTLVLNNSIVAGNTSPYIANIYDLGVTTGGNNITSGTAAQAGLDPAGLQNNGGPTQTIALTTYGTAVNAGSNAAAAGLTYDQRGANYPRIIGSSVDIGAYESLFVNTAPVADDKSATTDEDVAKAITLTATDADNNPLTYTVVDAPTQGTLSGTAPNLTYTPDANYNGPDSFTFKANDGIVDSNVATVSITVKAVNDAPTADDGTLSTDEDTAKSGTLVGNDIDGDALTYSIVTNGTKGSAVITDAGTGAYTYTPIAEENGTDTFTFVANDGNLSAEATITVTINSVNDAPVAVNDSATTNEDNAVTLNVKANDTDVDGDTLHVASKTNGAYGSVVINADGTVTYTPNANYNGPDSFTYTISDNNGGEGTATVTVTVNAVNDAPTAADQSVSTNEDVAKAITLGASDVDGDTLTYSLIELPQHGTLTNSDGSAIVNNTPTSNVVKYTPDANYPLGTMNDGSDSFSFVANDGTLDSNEAEVSITVHAVCDAPIAQGDSYAANEDQTLNVPAPGVLFNDEELDGEALHAVKVTGPAHGTLTLNDNGSFSYKANLNYNGADSFTYKATDGFLESATVTVTLTVNAINDAPLAVNDSATTDEDNPVTINVKANDSDVDGDTLHVASKTNGAHGNVVINADGTLTYTPNANYNGGDSFTYTISDGNGGEGTATVTVTVNAVNDAPTADDQSVTTDEDTAKAITLHASDIDGDALTYSIVSGPAHGTLSGSGANRTYTPNLNYNGSDSFTFKAKDGTVDSNTATVSITVKAVNDAPLANAGPDQTVTATGVTTPVTLNGSASSDIDGDTLTYAWTGAGVTASGANPTVNLPVGVNTITLTVTDPSGANSTDTVVITVNLPSNTSGGKVTGSGSIAGKTSGNASFNINPQVDKNGALKGSVTYTDGALSLSSTQITALVVNANGIDARIFGKGTVGGVAVTFVVNVKDVGEPGNGRDTFNITISNGYTNGGTINSGNIQTH